MSRRWQSTSRSRPAHSGARTKRLSREWVTFSLPLILVNGSYKPFAASAVAILRRRRGARASVVCPSNRRAESGRRSRFEISRTYVPTSPPTVSDMSSSGSRSRRLGITTSSEPRLPPMGQSLRSRSPRPPRTSETPRSSPWEAEHSWSRTRSSAAASAALPDGS